MPAPRPVRCRFADTAAPTVSSIGAIALSLVLEGFAGEAKWRPATRTVPAQGSAGVFCRELSRKWRNRGEPGGRHPRHTNHAGFLRGMRPMRRTTRGRSAGSDDGFRPPPVADAESARCAAACTPAIHRPRSSRSGSRRRACRAPG